MSVRWPRACAPYRTAFPARAAVGIRPVHVGLPTTSPPIDSGNVEAKLSYLNSLLFALDGLATNLEKGYRPAGDLIIEDADCQPTGIPSLCIEVCPTFYRDWTIPEIVMPVHDMSRLVQ